MCGVTEQPATEDRRVPPPSPTDPARDESPAGGVDPEAGGVDPEPDGDAGAEQPPEDDAVPL